MDRFILSLSWSSWKYPVHKDVVLQEDAVHQGNCTTQEWLIHQRPYCNASCWQYHAQSVQPNDAQWGIWHGQVCWVNDCDSKDQREREREITELGFSVVTNPQVRATVVIWLHVSGCSWCRLAVMLLLFRMRKIFYFICTDVGILSHVHTAPSCMKKKTSVKNLFTVLAESKHIRARAKTFLNCYFVIHTFRSTKNQISSLTSRLTDLHTTFFQYYPIDGRQTQTVWAKLRVYTGENMYGGLFIVQIFQWTQTIHMMSSVTCRRDEQEQLHFPRLNNILSRGEVLFAGKKKKERKDLLSSWLTHFIHSILMTRHLMWQRDAAVQNGLALWPQRTLAALLFRERGTGEPRGQVDPNSGWAGGQFQSTES